MAEFQRRKTTGDDEESNAGGKAFFHSLPRHLSGPHPVTAILQSSRIAERVPYNDQVVSFAPRAIRRILKEIDIRLEQSVRSTALEPSATNGQEAAIEGFLRSISISTTSRDYMEEHLPRLVHTLALAPPNGRSALELGSYVYGCAVLQRVLGYAQVRGR